MNDSSAIILRRQHSTGLDTPVWIYRENKPLHNNTPHQTVEYRLREEYAYFPVKSFDEKGPSCVCCVCVCQWPLTW